MSTLTKNRALLEALAADAVLYWHTYLWHHKHPHTRLLHHIGSWICLLGLGATSFGFGWFWIPLCIACGYVFAFAGHYIVERNRPLTLRSPIRAGICNWVMFFYEMFFDVEEKLRQLEKLNLDTQLMDPI